MSAGCAAPAAPGAQAQLVALPLLGSRSLLPGPRYGFQLSGKHYLPRRLMQGLRSQPAVGDEGSFIQMLQPSLLRPGREGLVPVGCSTLAPDPFTPGGFLLKFPRRSGKKRRNLCELDGAALAKWPWG